MSILHTLLLFITEHAMLNVANIFSEYHAGWHAYRQHARLSDSIGSITDMA